MEVTLEQVRDGLRAARYITTGRVETALFLALTPEKPLLAERPVVVLTSNRTRELSEALVRRCLHLFIDFPGPEKESEIIALKVPDLDVLLRTQVSRFVAGLRKLELRKAPSIAETLDWARGLCALGVRELDSAMVRQTLSLVLKHEEDLRKAEGKLGALLAGSGGRVGVPA